VNALNIKRRSGTYLILITLLAGGLRLFKLGSQSLWTDELLSYWAFTSTPQAPYWKKFLYDVHAPLYNLFLHFWSMVSLNEFWLRLPSALAGTTAVIVLYRWLRGFLGERISLTAALLMAVNPMHLYYSQEMRFYSFLVLFTVIVLIRFEKFIVSPNLKNSFYLAIAMIAMCMSHFSGLFIVLSLFFVSIIYSRKSRSILVRFLLAVVILVVVISPWIYREYMFLKDVREAIGFSVPQEERFREERSFTLWAYPYSVYAFSTGYSFGPDLRELHVSGVKEILRRHFIELILFSVGFVPVLVLGFVQAARRGKLVLFLSVVCISYCALSLLASMNVKVFNARYLLSAFPVFIAVVAAGIPGKTAARFFFTGVILAVMLISDYNYFFVKRYARDDVKGAVEVISREERDGDIILLITVNDVFKFYYRGKVPVVVMYPKTSGAEGVKRKIERLSGEYRRVWYIRCRSWDWDPDDVLLTELRNRFTEEETWEFPGVNLYLFVNK